MALRYPQPENEDDFEQMCLRLYRKLWQNESLVLYGKRGERQDGIDILDPLCLPPLRAVQCKHHESHKTITEAEIKREVTRVELSVHAISHYVIATTAKKSRKAQDIIAELNRREEKKFTVEIHFWEEICQHAHGLGLVTAELIIYGMNILAGTSAPLQNDCAHFVGSSSHIDIVEDDARYQIVDKLLNERQLDVARHELAKLGDLGQVDLLPRDERYKQLRLHAKLKMQLGEWTRASELFLRAFNVSPDLNQAKHNQVLAFTLTDDFDKAFSHALQYIHSGLATPTMVMHLINSITTPSQIADHLTLIKTHAGSDESVNVSLSHKYTRFKEFELAYESAQAGLAIDPDSPHAHFAAAAALHSESVNGRSRNPSKQRRLALTHYDAAERAAREQRYTQLLPEILHNRGTLKRLLGNSSGAVADFQASIDSATDEGKYAEGAIRLLIGLREYESVNEYVKYLDPTTRESRFLILTINQKQSTGDEKREYFDRMQSLAEEDWEGSSECRYWCVQWAMDLREYDLARSIVNDSFLRDYPYQSHAILAWIAATEGAIEVARIEAQKAVDLSAKASIREELCLLAKVLVKLGDDANAALLFERVTIPGILNDDMIAFIACAQRMDRHDLVLRLCRELRESESQDEQLRRIEVQLLSRYSPQTAFELAGSFIHISESPSYFVAFRNWIAVRLHQEAQLELEPSKLPTAAQLSPDEAHLVLMPYIVKGRHSDSLRFLHSHLRLNFEDESVHARYLFYCLKHAFQTDLFEPPQTVEVDCAVLLKCSNGERRWVLIEDNAPQSSRDEFSSTNVLSRAVSGKSIGDSIELPEQLLHPETAEIVEIQTKYVRMFQDCLENYGRRFPGTSVLKHIKVVNLEDFDPSYLIKSLEDRRDHIDRCVQMYNERLLSTYFLAERIGVTEIDAIQLLAQHSNGLVKAWQTTPRDFENAVRSGVSSQSIVLSISAICTLILCDGWCLLPESRMFLISHLTSELVDQWIYGVLEESSDQEGVVHLDPSDKLRFRSSNQIERSLRRTELLKARQWLDSRCEKTSSFSMASIAPESRTLYEERVGIHNVEAMSVARDRQAVLWSDDMLVSLVAKSDFEVAITWTQLSIKCFVESKAVTTEEFDLVTAKLAAWKYMNTMWNPATIIAAGLNADWQVEEWPFRQCISLISQPGVSDSTKTRVVIECLKLLRRSNCSELMQTPVSQAFLNALGDSAIARSIYQRLDELFGVDIPSAMFFRHELKYWLRFR